MSETAAFPFQDPTLPLEMRLGDLIGRMSLAQKAAQLVDNVAAEPALGLPAYSWWNEALHGVASAGIATVFPQSIGLAASFDVAMMRRVADAIGREGRIKHRLAKRAGKQGQPFTGLNFYSPNINIFRDPRWGRGQETYGEDPYLTGEMGVAFITGLQGDDPEELQVAATAKHFAVHSGPERGRHSFNAEVSAHDLEDTYLPAFREAVLRGKVAAVMTAYNRVNGVPACAHPFLMEKRLREDWGFQGQIVSDCDGVRHIFEQHHWAQSLPEAYAKAIRSGMTSVLDFFLGRDSTPILAAVEQGLITEAEIDRALAVNLAIRFRLGNLDPEPRSRFDQVPLETLDSSAHRALAQEAARKSLVLLQNNGVLPIAAEHRRIALVGSLADNQRVLLGSYHGTPSATTTLLAGMRRSLPEHEIRYEPGTSFLLDPQPVPAALLSGPEGTGGLVREFFAGADFSGAVLRRDGCPDVTYDGLPPCRPPEVPENSPVLWRGTLTPRRSGEYELGLMGNSARLWFDGALLIDDSGPHAPRASLARVTLGAGRAYPFQAELLPGLEQHLRLIWIPLPEKPLERAAELAEWADLVVAAVGLTAELENEEIKQDVFGFEGGDRLALHLPESAGDLLTAVKKSGKPLVVVLMSGGPISSPWAAEHADAVLQAWYPGEEGGAAIAETLAGTANPGGRLPVTVYRDVNQLPSMRDYAMAGRTYRYFGGTPLYRFGHGLSYTRFVYRGLELPQRVRAGEEAQVSVLVCNEGGCPGDEVAQLYVDFPPLPGAPRRALAGFARAAIAPGETVRLSFVIVPRSLSHVDPEGTRRIEPGRYRISVGGGQPDDEAPCIEGTIEVTGMRTLPP